MKINIIDWFNYWMYFFPLGPDICEFHSWLAASVPSWRCADRLICLLGLETRSRRSSFSFSRPGQHSSLDLDQESEIFCNSSKLFLFVYFNIYVTDSENSARPLACLSLFSIKFWTRVSSSIWNPVFTQSCTQIKGLIVEGGLNRFL